MDAQQTQNPAQVSLAWADLLDEPALWQASYTDRKPRLDVYAPHPLIRPRDEGDD